MLEIKVLHIETPESIIDRNDLIAGYESNYAMATFMARASQLKDKPVNFLQGHYSSGGGLISSTLNSFSTLKSINTLSILKHYSYCRTSHYYEA